MTNPPKFVAYNIPYIENIGGKFWHTIQVKTIDKEKFVSELQSVYMSNTFSVYRSVIIGEENFVNNSRFTKYPLTVVLQCFNYF